MIKTIKAIALASLLGFAASAQAIPVEVTFTADNVNDNGGLCDDMSCAGGTGWGSLPNGDNWQAADTVTFDLAPGTHWFAWHVVNIGAGSANNPAALLAEILWGGNSNASSSAWEYSTNRSSWFAATEYGNNGGSNIWGNNLGGAVVGISTDASWIWNRYNFNVEMHDNLWFRTSITIDGGATQVPEPGTLALFGLGLAGMGIASRRKRQV